MSINKKSKKLLSERIEKMAAWAIQRKEHLHNDRDLMASKGQYIRIGGNGFRAVSVSKDHPLVGYAKGSVKTLNTVLKHFESTHQLKKVEGVKEERRLQSWMIREALLGKGRLDTFIGNEFGCDTTFDEIHFVMDEISLGDRNHKLPLTITEKGEVKSIEGIIRCDLLAVGVKEGKAYPILIELKYDRSLGRLLDQLREFSNLITGEFRDEFQKLLTACLGREVVCSTCYEFLVWPEASKGERLDTIQTLKKSSVKVLEYKYHNETDICSSIKYIPYD